MDWDNLKFFLALAETGSLSRASEKLRVDHSTVSRRIDMLEHDLGVRVVERLSRAYRLTPEGEQVRDRAKEIEARIADIARFTNSMDQSSRVVRVSGPPTLSRRVFSRFKGSTPACASNWSARRARSTSARARPIWRFGWRGRSRRG